MNLDLIDKRILCALDENARVPLTKLAKKLRINRNVCEYRIKNLQEKGIIEKYICSISLGKLGYTTYKVYFKLHTNEQAETLFRKIIQEHKEAIHFLKTEGAFDYAVTLVVKKLSSLDTFLTKVKSTKHLIKDYLVSGIVSSKVFKIEKLFLDKSKEILKSEVYKEDEKVYTIDEKDVRILSCLAQNARTPLINLAKETHLTIDIVKYRLTQLEKGIISSYRPIFDFSKLGYFHYVIMLQTRSATSHDEDKLITWCMFKKNVLFITKRIGAFDFEINVAIQDIASLTSIMNELKKEFGTIIDSYETIVVSELLKLNYVPF